MSQNYIEEQNLLLLVQNWIHLEKSGLCIWSWSFSDESFKKLVHGPALV